ncbi:hypothetical protein BpHYR1_050384, partial [Brachionus plicatilis]
YELIFFRLKNDSKKNTGAISEIYANLKFDFGRFLPSKSLIQTNLIRLSGLSVYVHPMIILHLQDKYVLQTAKR